MMWSPSDPKHGGEFVPILRKEAVPKERGAESTGRWTGFKTGVALWWKRYVLGYAWSDIERLKEAKINEIESLSEERRATALAKLAEARKLDAEAENAYAEAEGRRLANEEKRLTIGLDSAYEQVRQKLRVIERKGGRVFIEGLAEESGQLSPAGDGEEAGETAS